MENMTEVLASLEEKKEGVPLACHVLWLMTGLAASLAFLVVHARCYHSALVQADLRPHPGLADIFLGRP